MNVHADLSFLTLILNASVIVQAIIALLALLSMWSWWQIFLKMFQLRRILRETDAGTFVACDPVRRNPLSSCLTGQEYTH